MRRNKVPTYVLLTGLLGSMLLGGCAHTHSAGVSGDGPVVLRDAWAEIHFDSERGTYDIVRREDGLVLVDDAVFTLNDWRSDDPGSTNTWASRAVADALGTGKALRVANTCPGRPSLLFEVVLRARRPYITFSSGVRNEGDSAFRVRRFSPLSDGLAVPEIETKGSLQFLNGDGGNAVMRVSRDPGLEATNNLMATFLDGGARWSLVAGGLTYHDFAKYCSAGNWEWTSEARMESLEGQRPEGARLVAYMDCGADWEAGSHDGPRAELSSAKFFEIPEARAVADPCFTTVIWRRQTADVRLRGLDPDKHYQLGFSWWDYRDHDRKASLQLKEGEERIELVAPRELPVWLDDRQPPEQWFLPLPPEVYADGETMLEFVNHNRTRGLNVFVCDLWLWEADAPVFGDIHHGPAEMNSADGRTFSPGDPLPLELWAEDPIGRLVAPGETYRPDDQFFLSLSEEDPLFALERYGLAVRTAQGARPNAYTFPTVCGWYVTIPTLGGGPDINNAYGLVDEMEWVAKKGFLRYSPAAVRLVPDCYEPNNEQGWWDDEHWLKFGHLCPPYETSEKWAQAVRARGGIPLTYFQTGRISEDYAAAFPGHMLWNDRPALVEKVSRPDGRPRSFDYTDPDFSAHVKRVYENLCAAGVRGLMFDYPDTGWRPEGGFEDPVTTTAAAYRRVFQFAKEGLGPHSFIHERLLRVTPQMPMTDMSVGLVDSQRVWGDTDRATAEMYSKCGLRWYKARRMYHYDMDAKNFAKVTPPNRDGLRQMLSMAYVTAGRLLLATTFRKMSEEEVHDLSRVYPMHSGTLTARPLDLLQSGSLPQVYDFPISGAWHQVALYNKDNGAPATLGASLSGMPADGGMGLAPGARYHVYDFWNDRYAGLFDGEARITQELRPGEVRMLSVRKMTPGAAQVVSTDRHLLQGYLDLEDVQWHAGRGVLEGQANTVAGEAFTITLGLNGLEAAACGASQGRAELRPLADAPGLAALVLEGGPGGLVSWQVRCLTDQMGK